MIKMLRLEGAKHQIFSSTEASSEALTQTFSNICGDKVSLHMHSLVPAVLCTHTNTSADPVSFQELYSQST